MAANKYKLLVLCNAACLELLVWAACDENGWHTYVELKFCIIIKNIC